MMSVYAIAISIVYVFFINRMDFYIHIYVRIMDINNITSHKHCQVTVARNCVLLLSTALYVHK